MYRLSQTTVQKCTASLGMMVVHSMTHVFTHTLNDSHIYTHTLTHVYTHTRPRFTTQFESWIDDVNEEEEVPGVHA